MAVTEQVIVDIKSKYDDSGLKALRKSASESNNELSKLESTAGASISSFAALSATIGITLVASLGAFITKAIQVGATFKNLKDNFAGTSEDIELFRKATAGTVSEENLIKLSNQASDLGLSLKNQTLLFNLAENAGDAYGGTIEQNFNKIISATEGSARGLKAIGISTRDYKQKLDELANSQGINLDNLEADEQLQIKLQAIYELTGVSIDDVKNKQMDLADVIDSLIPMTEDLISAFGYGLVSGFGDVGAKAEWINEQFLLMKNRVQDLGATIGNFIRETVPEWIRYAKAVSDAMQGDFTAIYGAYLMETPEQLPIRVPKQNELDKVRPRNTYTPKSNSSSSQSEKEKEIKFNFDNEISRNSLEKLSQAVYDNLILMPLMRTFKIGTQPVGTVTQDPFKEWLDSFMNQPTDLYTVDGLDIESIYSDSQKVLSNVQSLFSMLDTGTDTFINKLLQFFGMIQKGFEAIGLIKSIVGIVTGGIGARPGINNSQSAIYIGMNVNTLELYRTGREQFNRLQNKTRVF